MVKFRRIHRRNIFGSDQTYIHRSAFGLNLAQVALSYGADDIHGTIIEEHIFRMAGGGQGQGQTERELVKAIREAGREPVQRDTFYQPIVSGGAPRELAAVGV